MAWNFPSLIHTEIHSQKSPPLPIFPSPFPRGLINHGAPLFARLAFGEFWSTYLMGGGGKLAKTWGRGDQLLAAEIKKRGRDGFREKIDHPDSLNRRKSRNRAGYPSMCAGYQTRKKIRQIPKLFRDSLFIFFPEFIFPSLVKFFPGISFACL